MQPTTAEQEITQEERTQLINEYQNVPQSTNVDYRECLAVIEEVSDSFLDARIRTTLEILGASFEFLGQEPSKRVTPAEVLTFLSQPWRAALTELLAYPPAAGLLLYTRIIAQQWAQPVMVAGWGEQPEFGRGARLAFERVVELLQKVVALPAKQAEQQRTQEEAALQREQRMENTRQADQQQAQWMKDVSRGIRQGRRNGLVAQGALLALGVALGWIAGRKAAE